jgi:hypothetical protein
MFISKVRFLNLESKLDQFVKKITDLEKKIEGYRNTHQNFKIDTVARFHQKGTGIPPFDVILVRDYEYGWLVFQPSVSGYGRSFIAYNQDLLGKKETVPDKSDR